VVVAAHAAAKKAAPYSVDQPSDIGKDQSKVEPVAVG
jgi:hypothetical protein